MRRSPNARRAGTSPRLARAFGALLTVAAQADAHEYWLDPIDASPDADGGLLLANIRNGQEFAGSSLPFDPARLARVELVGAGGARALEGRLGDFPALHATLDGAGTWMLSLETGPRPLVYDDLAAFGKFLDYHGASAMLERHAERALPERGIRERYYRYAKTLVRTAGAADDVDESASAVFAPRGSRLELVPANDPYRDATLELSLLLEGVPLADAQVELFERAPDNTVTRRVEATDTDGRLRLDVARPGDYLVNAVRVLSPVGRTDADAAGEGDVAHWESLWASLTFEKR